MSRRLWITFALFASAPWLLWAQPALTLSTASIASDDAGSVRATITGLTDSTVTLSLVTDADGDGVVDAGEDHVVYVDRIADNGTRWSPNMSVDLDGAVGTVVVDLKWFTPIHYPNTVGHYIWVATDSGGGVTVAFEVTQASTALVLSGQVQLGDGTPVPGALVLLSPLGKEEGDGPSCIADASGDFTLYLPASWQNSCLYRLVMPVKPGYLTPVASQTALYFDATYTSDPVTPLLETSSQTVSGRLTYSSGPLSGSGIPGVMVQTETQQGLPRRGGAFTDADGYYTLGVTDGGWDLFLNNGLGLALKGAAERPNLRLPVTVSGGPVTGADLSFPAADAFLQGTVRNSSGAALAGGLRVWALTAACESGGDPNCYGSEALTAPDGTYTLGVVGGTGENNGLGLVPESILPGKIARGWTCEALASGQTLTGRDVDHLDPTQWVTGQVAGQNGIGFGGVGVWLTQYSSCRSYEALALTTCDGSFALPARDGAWNLSVTPDDKMGYYRGMDASGVQESITLSGGSGLTGANLILGPWLQAPYLTEIYPQSGYTRAPVEFRGVNLGEATPECYWYNSTFSYFVAATVLSYRSDTGDLWVEGPNSGADRYFFFVSNPEMGLESNTLCFSGLGDPPSSDCALTGTVTDGANPVEGALVKISDGLTEVRGFALTDAAGAYTATLPEAASDYTVTFLPPQGSAWVPGAYSGVSVTCPGPSVRDHTFAPGVLISGSVADSQGRGLQNAQVSLQRAGSPGVRTLTAWGGSFQVRVPTGSGYALRVVGPPGSRYVAERQGGLTFTADTSLGTVTLDAGVLFVANIRNSSDQGRGRFVDAYRVSDGAFAGRASTQLSDSCLGRFSIALPQDTPTRLDLSTSNPTRALTTVLSVSLHWDSFAQMDFPVFSSSGKQFADLAPHFGRQLTSRGQEGQPLDIWGEQYGPGALEALFRDSGGILQLPGDSPLADADRGVLLTRVPAGAASGNMELHRTDGGTTYASPPFPFTRLTGTFAPGTLAVTGTVTAADTPLPGVVVVALWAESGGCDGNNTLVDYAITDEEGDYALATRPGDLQLVLFPPAGLGLAGASYAQSGVAAAVDHDFALTAGYLVQAVLQDGGGNPIPDARVEIEGESAPFYDARLADASGAIHFPLPEGTYRVRVYGPELSRFLQVQFTLEVTGDVDLGTQVLEAGRLVTARAVDSHGGELPGSEAWTQQLASPHTDWGRCYAGYQSRASLPVRSGEAFRWGISPVSDAVLEMSAESVAVSADSILYPSIVLGPGGVVSGTVTEQGTGTPLGDIPVRVFAPGEAQYSLGSAQTCPNGKYRMKLPTGTYILGFNEDDATGDSAHAAEYFSEAYCEAAATALVVGEGSSTVADEQLNRGSTVSGTIWDSTRAPLSAASALATGVALGSCTVGAGSGTDGSYRLRLPEGTFRLQGASAGFGNQCWDHDNSCAAYTPVVVVSGAPVTGVDFDLGSPPPEVSSKTSGVPARLRKNPTPGELRYTFQKVSGAETYNVYVWSNLRLTGAPLATHCLMVPGGPEGLVDNGDGTMTFTFTPPEGAKGFLVSASNTVGECSLGFATSGERDVPPSSWRCGNSPR